MNRVARLAAVNCSAGKISRNSTPNSTPAKMPPASVPSRAVSGTPRERAQIAITANAPTERTVAWMNGGISGSASFTDTWLRPHDSVRPSMISAATASSGREVDWFTSDLVLPAMPAHAGNLDHRALRRKPRILRRCIQAVSNCARRGFAHRAAMLADEKHHRRVRRVIADAGEKRVAAFDPVHEPLSGEEIERAIDRDRRRARAARRDLL